MGNPYLRVLRSQLEKYIVEELGGDYLMRVKNQTELRAIKKEMADLKKRLVFWKRYRDYLCEKT